MKTDDAASRPPRPPWWADPATRALVMQALAVLAVVLVTTVLLDNVRTNLQVRGIASGFGFLDSQAGFGIAQSLIPYSTGDSYARVFVVGLLNTLLVSLLGIILATALGFVLGVARLSSNWLVSRLALAYIEVIRNIPLLLQIFFWYFAVLRNVPPPRDSLALGDVLFLNLRGLYLPRPLFEPGFGLVLLTLLAAIIGSLLLRGWARCRQDRTGQTWPVLWTSLGLLAGLPLLAFLATGQPLGWEKPVLAGFNFRGGWTVMPEMAALVLALTLYTAAFIAEIVRSGILSVSHGQTEAAYALGLHPGLTLRLVILPQAMRVIIPPLTSQYLNLTKNSSLAAAIGYPDLVSLFAGTVLNQTGQAIEVIVITMAVYLTISLSISLLMNIYNRRMALVER